MSISVALNPLISLRRDTSLYGQDYHFLFIGWIARCNLTVAMKLCVQSFLMCVGVQLINTVLASPALPILAINQNHTALTGLNTSRLGNRYQCFEPEFKFVDRRAYIMDCLRAAAFLPNFHQPGLFYRGNDPDDPFALPYQMTIKTCRIKVDLDFGHPDHSSWIAINLAVGKIIDACKLRTRGSRTGGQTWAGNAGYIVITAENSKWRGASLASKKSVERLLR